MRTLRIAESISLVALTALCVAAPVSAQIAIPRWPSGPSYDQGSYDRGFREGREHGEDDARANRAFDYRRHREYRNGDSGWGRGNGDAYRRGFEDGYRQGYERNQRYGRGGGYGYPGNGGYGNGRYPDDRYGYPGGGYGYPGNGGYGYGREGYSRGFEDGLRKGREDGRDGDRFDPMRHKDYRNADDGYNRRYGSKDAYRASYRDGFRQGYERGYRESGRGGWRR